MLRGQIILWWGSIETIPDDWNLCDGTNGTPNLADKFIWGAGVGRQVGSIGGTYNHNHDFTGDGHDHNMAGGDFAAAGINIHHAVTDNAAQGTTDNEDNIPPFYALAYIMKLHDDPDPRNDLPWPYAAKAIVRHTYREAVLEIWITFRFKMNTDNKPPNASWKVEADEVPEAIDSSAWQDQWTMLLTIDPLVGAPAKVTVEYDGPDDDLATIWNKQWEPWGPIVSVEEPTPLEALTFTTGPAAQDDVDVAGIGVLFLDATANNITIGGFVGGVRGQVLHIAKIDDSANNVTLEEHEGGGNQDIHLHAEADETLINEHGGWILACDGNDWYDTSHAKHV